MYPDIGCFEVDYKNKNYIFRENIDSPYTSPKNPVCVPFGSFMVDFLSVNVDAIFNKALAVLTEKNALYCMGSWDERHTHITRGFSMIVDVFGNECDWRMAQLLTGAICSDPQMINKLTYDIKDMSDICELNRVHFRCVADAVLSFQKEVSTFISKKEVNEDGFISSVFSDHSQNITASFRKDGNYFYQAYELTDLFSLIALEIINVQQFGISIKQCRNCGKYFIPVHRSDELYCDSLFSGGRTCKEVGFERVGQDSFYREYRRIYKLENAKMNRNRKNMPDYYKKYFDPWDAAAKEAMSDYKSRDDLEGFKQWLSSHRIKVENNAENGQF